MKWLVVRASFDWLFPLACSAMLVLLWLPGLRFPILSDTAVYAMLGQSFWQHGTYLLFGEPYAKHLPLHAILSFPFTAFFGVNLGMKLSSLLAGIAVLYLTFLLARRFTSRSIAAIATLGILSHPGFILMTTLGSADLLFTALFLGFVLAYLKAAEDSRQYLVAGICLGLACLTRYNGVPVFLFFIGYTLWKRPADRRNPFFFSGIGIALLLFGIWLLRNTLTFGQPLFSDYSGELQAQSPDHLRQFVSNIFYYLNPVHNVFPFFFPFAAYGLLRYGKRYPELVLSGSCVLLLTAVWWVQAIRFAFPAYPILLLFAAFGVRDLLQRWRWSWIVLLFLGVALQSASLCVYSYGSCNAWVDRTFAILPPNMGLTSEGFFAWSQARDYVNAHVETGAVIVTDAFSIIGLEDHAFRSDIRLSTEHAGCPRYRIAQRPPGSGDTVLFRSAAAPQTAVIEERCQ